MQLHDEVKPERRSSVRIKAEIRVFYGEYQSKLLTGYSIDLRFYPQYKGWGVATPPRMVLRSWVPTA